MKDVKIYTWTTCPYCIRAKKLLSNKGVKYSEVVIDGDREALSELKKITGIGSVPQIFVDDKFIGGCDDLHELEASGELDKLLQY
jgi:glutaredoxin 3